MGKFRTLLSQLEEWRPGVGFGDLDRAGLLSFCGHLRDGLGLLNSTASKKLGYLRWFLRWAAGKGYTGCLDFEDFRPNLKQAQNRVVFLTWDELMRVWDYTPPSSAPWLGQVRDIFCFCAFTSCRYSDAEDLRWADVFERSFFIVSRKTGDPLEIDLNKWSREILERSRGREYPDGRVLPQITNQVANRALKRIARECGICSPVRRTVYDASGRREEIRPKWELVGTHTARRTFICNALMMGIPPNVVMKWTGHSSYNAMRPYIDVADGVRREAMEGFDKLQK